MRLFKSMKEFDSETVALWKLLATEMTYDSFMGNLAIKLGCNNFYELRQNCKATNRVTDGFEGNPCEIISSAVEDMGIELDITRWSVRQLRTYTSILDIKGGESLLKELIEEGSVTVSEAHIYLEESFDECKYIFIPAEIMQDFTIDLDLCPKRHLEQFWSALSHSINTEATRNICQTLLSSKEKQWYPNVLELIDKNPVGLYKVLLYASEDFQLFVADHYSAQPHLKERSDTEYLASYCLDCIFNSGLGYESNLDYNSPIGFASGIQYLEKERGDTDSFDFSMRFGMGKTMPVIELDRFPDLLMKHATTNEIDTPIYIRSCLLALLNSGHIHYYNASLPAIKNIISEEQFKELSDISEFANQENGEIKEFNSESRLLTHAAMIRASTDNLDSPEKVENLLSLIVKNINQGTLKRIPVIVSRLCPSLSEALIYDLSNTRAALSMLLPAFENSTFFEDAELIKQFWKLACLAKNSEWVEMLTPYISGEYLPLQRLLHIEALETKTDDFDVEEINRHIDEAKYIISDILNPTKFWARPDSAHFGTPRILALLYTLNELTIEKREFNKNTTFYTEDIKIDSHDEDVQFLSQAPGGESYANRIDLFIFLRDYPGYDDLIPKCDCNFYYLYSKKQSEVIFVTSVGFERLNGIANELNAKKLTFANFSYNQVILDSITIPQFLHVLNTIDCRMNKELYTDVQSALVNNHLQSNALNALKLALEPQELILPIGDVTFKFGFSNRVIFGDINSGLKH